MRQYAGRAAARDASRATEPAEWFLTGEERGNDATRLLAWSEGNLVRPLVHGSAYFAELEAGLAGLDEDDLLLFADWRGDPDERLTPDGPGVASAMARAAGRVPWSGG